MIFGGATGDTGKYIITGDTYALDLISSKWSKLEGKYSVRHGHPKMDERPSSMKKSYKGLLVYMIMCED